MEERRVVHFCGGDARSVQVWTATPDDMTIIVGSVRMLTIIWLANSEKGVKEIGRRSFYSYSTNKSYHITALAVSDDGAWVAIGSNEGSVVLLNVRQGIYAEELRLWDTSVVKGAVFDKDTYTFQILSEDGFEKVVTVQRPRLLLVTAS